MKTNLKCLIGLFFVFMPLLAQNAPASTNLKLVPENAEKCKEEIRVDVTEIVSGESPKTTLIPDSDFKSIKEQYELYKKQRAQGDLIISAESELKNRMVEIYCEGVGDNSNTTNGNTKSEDNESNNAQNGDDDELVNELKAEVKRVVDAFKETKEKINKKGA